MNFYNNYPQQPQQQQNNGLLWVQGESGAKSWVVAPGNTVMLMDAEASKFYLKSADNSGMPTLRTFEYKEVNSNHTNNGEFVTKNDFNELSDRFKSLEEKMEELFNERDIQPNG